MNKLKGVPSLIQRGVLIVSFQKEWDSGGFWIIRADWDKRIVVAPLCIRYNVYNRVQSRDQNLRNSLRWLLILPLPLGTTWAHPANHWSKSQEYQLMPGAPFCGILIGLRFLAAISFLAITCLFLNMVGSQENGATVTGTSTVCILPAMVGWKVAMCSSFSRRPFATWVQEPCTQSEVQCRALSQSPLSPLPPQCWEKFTDVLKIPLFKFSDIAFFPPLAGITLAHWLLGLWFLLLSRSFESCWSIWIIG